MPKLARFALHDDAAEPVLGDLLVSHDADLAGDLADFEAAEAADLPAADEAFLAVMAARSRTEFLHTDELPKRRCRSSAFFNSPAINSIKHMLCLR